jgi:hypothetical protein
MIRGGKFRLSTTYDISPRIYRVTRLAIPALFAGVFAAEVFDLFQNPLFSPLNEERNDLVPRYDYILTL